MTTYKLTYLRNGDGVTRVLYAMADTYEQAVQLFMKHIKITTISELDYSYINKEHKKHIFVLR